MSSWMSSCRGLEYGLRLNATDLWTPVETASRELFLVSNVLNHKALDGCTRWAYRYFGVRERRELTAEISFTKVNATENVV